MLRSRNAIATRMLVIRGLKPCHRSSLRDTDSDSPFSALAGYGPGMANTFTSLHYHVIFSSKNREPRIRQDIEQRVWSYLVGIARENDMKAVLVGGILIHPPSLKSPAPSPCEARAGRGRGERGSFHRIVALF